MYNYIRLPTISRHLCFRSNMCRPVSRTEMSRLGVHREMKIDGNVSVTNRPDLYDSDRGLTRKFHQGKIKRSVYNVRFVADGVIYRH